MLLVDERPEEVTEMRRTIKGEVIASSSDKDTAATSAPPSSSSSAPAAWPSKVRKRSYCSTA